MLSSIALDIYMSKDVGDDEGAQECLELPGEQVVFKCLWSNDLEGNDW